MQSKHALFEKYPLDGQVKVGEEMLTTPYHIYDGSMALLGGTADKTAVSDLLARERLVPILDADGRALMAVWICDFTKANLGPHQELQISLFATSRPIPRQTPHPFNIFRALTVISQTRMVCHGLWNSDHRVARYNSEHLGLNARFSSSQIQQTHGRWRCRFEDEDGCLIADGDLGVAVRQSPVVMWQLLRHIGIQGLMQSIRSPFVHVPVVNTRSQFAKENLVAHTYSRSAKQVIRPFDSEDRFVIKDPMYASLDFAPAFVQQLEGVQFVYLRPQADDA